MLDTHWIAPFDRAGLAMLYPGTGAWNPVWDLKLALLSWGPSMLVEVAPECWPAIAAATGPGSTFLAAQGTLRGDLDAIGTALALVHAADTVDAAQFGQATVLFQALKDRACNAKTLQVRRAQDALCTDEGEHGSCRGVVAVDRYVTNRRLLPMSTDDM